MTWDTLRKSIHLTLARMAEAYARPVFDEWAIVILDPTSSRLLDYHGPRQADFLRQFHENLIPLTSELLRPDLEPGDFSFAREAKGADFDAFLVLAPKTFLLCNATSGTVEQITRDPRWKSAQVPFVALSEKLRADPLIP